MPLFVFITGASGSGKTSVLQALQYLLKDNAISIHYFDFIGVPTYEDMIKQYGSPEAWQKNATKNWIQKLITLKDQLIILEGSFNPEFVVNEMKLYDKSNYLVFCIHTDQIIRETRLLTVRNQPELVTQDMENFAQFLKHKTEEIGGTVIENNNENIQQVAEKIITMISAKTAQVLQPCKTSKKN